MEEVPPAVNRALEKLRKSTQGFLQLRKLGGRYYVQRATSVWDKVAKRPRKVTEHFGSISLEGQFTPKRSRSSVPATQREVFEYGNGALARQLVEDVKASLALRTPYADELLAMAIIRAIDPRPLRLHPSRWERLHLSRTWNVNLDPTHLAEVLRATGAGKAWWHEFFDTLRTEDEYLFYDLTSVFSWSENIQRAEKGYNPDHLYQDQVGVVMAFSARSQLPAGVDVYWGSMKDITTFRDFLKFFDAKDVGFVVDRGIVAKDLLKEFREKGVHYVAPLRKNDALIDLRQTRWQTPFLYRERPIRWTRRQTEHGWLYLFDDPGLRGDQEQALLRRLAQGTLTRTEFQAKKRQAGVVAMLSDLDKPGIEVYELYKGREDIELTFDAMKHHLDADKTWMRSDDAIRGFFFVTFLALRIYWAVLRVLRQKELTNKISVAEVFFELSKIERIVDANGAEVYAKIPRRAERIAALFPELHMV